MAKKQDPKEVTVGSVLLDMLPTNPLTANQTIALIVGLFLLALSPLILAVATPVVLVIVAIRLGEVAIKTYEERK